MADDVSEPLRLFLAEEMVRVETLSLSSGVVAAFSAKSPEKTSENEDAALVVDWHPSRAVLAVADGLGGHASGDWAAQATLRQLHASLCQAQAEERSLRHAILNGIENANQRLLQNGSGAATTLAVVELDGRTIRPYHVGDSAIFVFGQRGKVKLQTISHSPVGYATASGLLPPEEAIHHEDRHMISNVVGAADMRIEIGPTLDLNQFDTLLLASDGLLDNLHLDEIVEGLRKGPIDRAAQSVVDQAIRRMNQPLRELPSKPDDLTLLAFRPARLRQRTIAKH